MKVCKKKSCLKKHHAKGYCAKHYAHLLKYGKIIERTRFDGNGIIAHPLYLEISLYNNRGTKIGRAKIDKRDLNLIKDYKWRLNKQGHVISGQKYIFYMHNLFINQRPYYKMTFKNGDKTDNRRENLIYKDLRSKYGFINKYINQDRLGCN